MRLNTARIFVRDLDAARSFYRDKLGLPLRAHSAEAGYCVFESGGTQLVVETVPGDAPAEEQALVGRFTGLSFTVEDVAAAYRRLVSLEVAFTGAPEAQEWGGILATFADPAGNELQLVQPAAGQASASRRPGG
jgi:catechol 2,3-dioxygenase-like lactoylglutathione lyase family enzyme